QAEAQQDEPVAGRAPVTARRPAKARGVAPAPAPEHPERGLGNVRPGRIVARRLLVVTLVVSIPAPLIDVAVHVVEAPGVGVIAADGGGIDEPVPSCDGPRVYGMLFPGRSVRDISHLRQPLLVV